MIQGISKVGVVGLGVMGFDIAFLYAMRACQTVVYDNSRAVMDSLTGRSPTGGIKILQAPLKEIDSCGDTAILQELPELNHEMPEICLTAPELFTAMAGERQTFFKNNQSNPWLLSLVKTPTSHARH
jgi:hypothetical protein